MKQLRKEQKTKVKKNQLSNELILLVNQFDIRKIKQMTLCQKDKSCLFIIRNYSNVVMQLFLNVFLLKTGVKVFALKANKNTTVIASKSHDYTYNIRIS